MNEIHALIAELEAKIHAEATHLEQLARDEIHALIAKLRAQLHLGVAQPPAVDSGPVAAEASPSGDPPAPK